MPTMAFAPAISPRLAALVDVVRAAHVASPAAFAADKAAIARDGLETLLKTLSTLLHAGDTLTVAPSGDFVIRISDR